MREEGRRGGEKGREGGGHGGGEMMPSETGEHTDGFGQVEDEQELVMTYYGVFCDYSFLVIRIEDFVFAGTIQGGKIMCRLKSMYFHRFHLQSTLV